MHSGRTGAACNSSPACHSKEHSRCSDVSPRENKQNRGHFFQDRRDCQNKSGPLLPLQNRDSVVRVTVRPLLKGARREGGGAGGLFCRMFVQPAFQTHKSFTRDFMCVCSRAPPPLLFGSPDEVILQQLHLRSERGDGILRAERGAGVNTARESTRPQPSSPSSSSAAEPGRLMRHSALWMTELNWAPRWPGGGAPEEEEEGMEGWKRTHILLHKCVFLPHNDDNLCYFNKSHAP